MEDLTSKFPDRQQEEIYEEGYPLPEPPPPGRMPPGEGHLAVPHYLTFSQIVNYASRTYRWTHDEALRTNRNTALAVRRDPVVMDALRSRQLPTAQLPWHIECEDDQDTKQQEGVSYFTDIVRCIPRFQQLKMHLLEALWFGRYGTQLTYQWGFKRGQKRLYVRDFKPINGDKLVFKYSGTPGVLVHATYPGTWQVTDRGRAHFFTSEEREQLIIHKHEPEDSDFFEPELAGGLQGVGIRGRIFWLWYLRSQVTSFLMDYLERVGAGGLTIYYYEAGNQQSLNEVQAAAEAQWRNNAILFPRYRDGTTGGPGVERIESSTAGAQLMQALVTNYYDTVIRRYILGQSQPEQAAGAGLGSGISDFLEGNLGRYIKYDAENLAETLTTDLVAVLQRYSPYAGCPPFKFVFDVDKPNSAETLEAAQVFFDMGGTIDEDQLRSVIGLEKPQPGHAMLAKMGAMSPAAAGAVPTGVPMLGQPGPDVGGQPQPGMDQAPPDMQGQPMPVQMSRKGEPLRYARQKKLRQWNPAPYLRAIVHHFGQDQSESGLTVVNLAQQALKGDRQAMTLLGDALQESSEPEWYNTVINHGLAWPPWNGIGGRNRNKRPTLMRHVVWPRSDYQSRIEGQPPRSNSYQIYEAHPEFNVETQRHEWKIARHSPEYKEGLTEDQLAGAGLQNPIHAEPHRSFPDKYFQMPRVNLTWQELSLLSRPYKADENLFADQPPA